MTSGQKIRHKDLALWARLARRQGWTVEMLPSGHIRWTPPDGERPQSTGSTPDGTVSVTKCKAQLEKAGLILNAAELRRKMKDDKPDPTKEQIVAASRIYCRYEGCSDTFRNAHERDTHEQFDCKFKRSAPPPEERRVAERAAAAKKKKSSTNPKYPCPLAGWGGCKPGYTVSSGNVRKHFESKHPLNEYCGVEDGVFLWKSKEPAAWGGSKRPPVSLVNVAASDRETGENKLAEFLPKPGDLDTERKARRQPEIGTDDEVVLIDLVLEELFPNGIPTRMRHRVAEWETQTAEFITAIREMK